MIQKFRPALSAAQINLLIQNLSFGKSKEEDKLKSYLQTFQVKIGNSLVSAGYAAKEKISIEESLGLEVSQFPTTGIGISIEDIRKAAYMKYKSNPSACTKNELEQAYNYGLCFPDALNAEDERYLESILFN